MISKSRLTIGIASVLMILGTACSQKPLDIRAAPIGAPEAVAGAQVETTAGTGQINATIKDMSITLDSNTAPAGKVTFSVTNDGPSVHEFVVLKSNTQAADFPIASFEGEANRFNEDAKGITNVGEAGEVQPGATKSLTIKLDAGHYAIVCNLPGHYGAGMHQDFTVTPAVAPVATPPVQATIKDMSITLSAATAPAGKVTFAVTNDGPSVHEFVVLKSNTQAADFPIASFEGEANRFNEDAKGITNVGEAGEVQPGATKNLTIKLDAGHYAIVCNLPGHYGAGMHQDFLVTAAA